MWLSFNRRHWNQVAIQARLNIIALVTFRVLRLTADMCSTMLAIKVNMCFPREIIPVEWMNRTRRYLSRHEKKEKSQYVLRFLTWISNLKFEYRYAASVALRVRPCCFYYTPDAFDIASSIISLFRMLLAFTNKLQVRFTHFSPFISPCLPHTLCVWLCHVEYFINFNSESPNVRL